MNTSVRKITLNILKIQIQERILQRSAIIQKHMLEFISIQGLNNKISEDTEIFQDFVDTLHANVAKENLKPDESPKVLANENHLMLMVKT